MTEVGRRRASKHSQPRAKKNPLLQAIAAVVGALLAGAAWVFLVRSAIEFGSAARTGDSIAWLFSATATLGAVVCLVLVFVLITRATRALRLTREYKPRRSARRH